MRFQSSSCASALRRSSSAIPASPLTFLYGLCRKVFSVLFDDPLSVLDATGVANIAAIRGCKPFPLLLDSGVVACEDRVY